MKARARRTRRGTVVSMAFAALLVAGHSMAQEAQVLTLEQALEIAEARNPAFRQANNRVQLNGTEMRTTWLDQILPRANVTLFNTSFTGNHQGKATDNLGYPIDNPDAAWVYFSSTRQALDVSWRIQGASLFQAFRRQRITNRERNVARDRAFTEMDVSVRRLFMDALEQRELMLAEEELVAAREVDREVAERLFSLALRTRVDVLNAELAIEQQALARQQQRALFERAKLTLRTELGDDELGDFILADEPLPIFDPSALDADELVERALGVNPDLRQREVAVESARLGVAENRNSWWPTVDLGMRVSRVAQTQETAALFDVSFDEDLDSNFYIQLSVPMFNSYAQNRQSMHRAEVDLDNAREVQREARLQVEETVRGAVLELDNQWESLRLAERSAEIAREALRLAREEYRIGARTFEDLRQGIDQEADTRRQVIQARHQFVDALLSLEEAVGAEIRPTTAAGGR
jgi:outer membrane protein